MSAALRTLTERELNRALLARQQLLTRAALSVPKALEQVAGIQAQYAPSSYVGLWSRVEAFERDQLTSALEQRTVVQGTLMRVTIHLVSAGDYWPFVVATTDARRAIWLRAHAGQATAPGMVGAATRLRGALGDEPMRRVDLDALVGKPASGGVGLWLDLVRVPPSGTWERRRADLYAAAEDWLGPPEVGQVAATAHLIRPYLGALGPSTVPEIANWSGLRPEAVRAALADLTLRRFRAEDGQELLDVPRGPLPDADTPSPVRFLPVWDATLLAHARRKNVIAEEHRPLVFNTKTPHSMATFLVDGRVAGTWKYDKGHVQVAPFTPLGRATRRQVDDEAERLGAFHA
jgi:hypothetical protein